MQKTLIIFKPDCVQRRLVGQILARFESKGRFSKMLAGMPTWLILDESPGLIGLANMPLE